MKVLIIKASDPDYEEVIEVQDWNEAMKRLLKKYDTWIIEPIWEILKVKYPDVEWVAIMYDDRWSD